MASLPTSARAAALILLGAQASLTPAHAAGASAEAVAMVVAPASVNAWLGVPVSVQDLLMAQSAPASPATGALVPRVTSATTPASLRAVALWIASAVDSRGGFAIDIVPTGVATLMPAGPAAAVSVAAAGPGAEGDGPLVITVAFN